MTKYLVKKQFKHTNGNTWTEGESYDADADHAVTKFLNHNGFIEEVKEDSRWRAKIDDMYFCIDTSSRRGVRVNEVKEDNDDYDKALNKEGNYFKSEETANKVAEALKQLFEHLHTPDETTELFDLITLIERARNAVLADDKRGSDEQ